MNVINTAEIALFKDIDARARADRARQQRIANFESQAAARPLFDELVFPVVAIPFVAGILMTVLQALGGY